jgi:hypothetical protein
MKTILAAALVAILALTSCNQHRIYGNKDVITRQYNVQGFREIDVSSELEVHLRQGPEFAIKIEGESNLLEELVVRKEGDALKIGFKDFVSAEPNKTIRVFITAPEFRKLEASGACTFISEQQLSSTGRLEIDLSGACETILDISAQSLDIDASGATEINLKGRVNRLSVDASGASTLNCYDLIAEDVKVDISGSGDAYVYASKSLNVEVSGAGNVQYKGNPPSVKQNISGAGSISSED